MKIDKNVITSFICLSTPLKIFFYHPVVALNLDKKEKNIKRRTEGLFRSHVNLRNNRFDSDSILISLTLFFPISYGYSDFINSPICL